MTTVSKKVTSLRLEANLHKHLMRLAKKENRSFNNYMETLLAKASNYHEPNEETKQAIHEGMKEKSSQKRYNNAKEALDDILGE